MKKILTLSSLLLLLLSCVSYFTAQADVNSLYPTTDTFINQLYPDNNFAYNDAISVGEWNGAVGDVRRGLMNFNLTSIPSNAKITSATLSLTEMTDFSSNPGFMSVYPLEQSFVGVETTWHLATNSTNWNNVGGTYSQINIGSIYLVDNLIPLDTVNISLSSQEIEAQLGNISYGILLKTEEEVDDLNKYHSLSSQTYRPKLNVVYFIPETIPTDMHLFAFIGASNGSGAIPVPPNQISDPRIYNFGNDYIWHKSPIEPIDSPINQVDVISQSDGAGYGMSLAFAKEVLILHPDWKIGLIPCADGGTTVWDWQDDGDNSLYGSCRRRILTAMQNGTLTGIISWMGENDAKNQKDAEMWGNNFNLVIDNLRLDFGNVPLVFAEIGNVCAPNEFPYWEIVQTTQENFIRENTASFPTNDMTLYDCWHVNYAGYDLGGYRGATQMEGLLND